jgi:dolichol kinase
MKILIKSFAGLIAAILTCFFVFALQGLATWAVGCGILAIVSLFIRSIVVVSKQAPNPIYSPSRSRQVKARRLRMQHS